MQARNRTINFKNGKQLQITQETFEKLSEAIQSGEGQILSISCNRNLELIINTKEITWVE